jgi:hypothetical protein
MVWLKCKREIFINSTEIGYFTYFTLDIAKHHIVWILQLVNSAKWKEFANFQEAFSLLLSFGLGSDGLQQMPPTEMRNNNGLIKV